MMHTSNEIYQSNACLQIFQLCPKMDANSNRFIFPPKFLQSTFEIRGHLVH